MNAAWSGAAAEWTGVGLTIAGVVGGLTFALLRTRFVTRADLAKSHATLSQRIDVAEAKLEGKVNKEDLQLLNDRLFGCEQSLATTRSQLAESSALLKANTEASRSLERRIEMLFENELRGERTRA